MTVLGSDTAGDVMLPLHVNAPTCDAFKGLKVIMLAAISSLGGDDAMVMPFPRTSSLSFPAVSNHIAVGIAERPEIVSDIMQVRENDDPATLLPVWLTTAEMRFEGTTQISCRHSLNSIILDYVTHLSQK